MRLRRPYCLSGGRSRQVSAEHILLFTKENAGSSCRDEESYHRFSTPMRTEFIASYYHTPSDTVSRLFYSVVRAGHLRAPPHYHIERDHLPGHDLLLCFDVACF